MSIEFIGLILACVVLIIGTVVGVLLYFHVKSPPVWEQPELITPACPSCSFKEKSPLK